MPSNHPEPAVQAAAVLPGEYPFISAIADDLCDDGRKLVYADWLEDRGDRRASFVREFVAATRALNNKSRLPDANSYPRAWTNMLGVPLIKGIIKTQVVDMKDLVLRLARPMLTIQTTLTKEDRIPVGASKFGGRPDLPKDVDWPSCQEGRLAFLGQIALSELKGTQVARSFPADGLLSFFAYDHNGAQPGNFDPETGVTQVRLIAPTEKLERRDRPEVGSEADCELVPACRLTICESWDLPSRGDKLPRKHAKDMKRFDEIDFLARGDVRDHSRPKRHYGHHLLGYACHFRTSDPSPGLKWPHLLCLDSDDNTNWNWCDGEHLAVFVHEDDFRKGSFSRVYGYAS